MKDQVNTETKNDPIHDEIGDLETHIRDFSDGGGAADYLWMGTYRQAFHISHLVKFIDVQKVSQLPSIKKAARSSLVAFRKAESLEESFFNLLRRGKYMDTAEDEFIADNHSGGMKLNLTADAFIEKLEKTYAHLLAVKIQQKDSCFFRRITNHFNNAEKYERADSFEITANRIVLAAWPYSFCLMTDGAASTFFRCCKRLIERDSPQLFANVKDIELSQENFRQIKNRAKLISVEPSLIRDISFNKNLAITAVVADPSILRD